MLKKFRLLGDSEFTFNSIEYPKEMRIQELYWLRFETQN